MTKMKKSGAPADGAPSDGTSTKKTGASQKPKRSDTSRMMLWAAPVVVLVAAGIAFVSKTKQWHDIAPTHEQYAAQTRQGTAPEKENSTPSKTAAKGLGVDPTTSAKLPKGWSSATDPTTGAPYYFKQGSRETQWEFPTEAVAVEAPGGGRSVAPVAGEPGEPADCAAWAAAGECTANPAFMRTECKVTCERADEAASAHLVDLYTPKAECVQWAQMGECESNKAFMQAQCAFSCSPAGIGGKVDSLRAQYRARCPRAPDVKPALAPDAMNATFERVMSEFGDLQPELLSSDPPVVLFHNFLSEAEAEAFIRHGKGKYTESRGVGIDENGKTIEVKTEIRTSRHAWCMESACLEDPLVQAVQQRVSDVTQVPVPNTEFAQLVHYNACPKHDDPTCAFYRRHSDWIDGDIHLVQGVRLYTMFMYLNDVPEDGGGGTRFTDLPGGPLTIQPKRGRAVLWPSVLASDPDKQDHRTHHEAMTVFKGEKFGANFWIHQYDFRTPYKIGCTLN